MGFARRLEQMLYGFPYSRFTDIPSKFMLLAVPANLFALHPGNREGAIEACNLPGEAETHGNVGFSGRRSMAQPRFAVLPRKGA